MVYAPAAVPIRVALADIPRPPSSGATYQTTVTTTVNENTSTFTNVAIGTPHPDRIVVLAIFHGVGASASSTVAGYDQYHLTQQSSVHEFSVTAHKVPNNITTADITVTAAASVRKAVSVYTVYPWTPSVVDFATDSAAAGTNAVAVDLKTINGGCVIYSGGQQSTLSTFTTTWGGVDAITEDVDAQLEAASSYTAGHINLTRSSDLDDLTMAASVNGVKRLESVAFYPPRYFVG